MPEGPTIVILREEAGKFAGKRVREVSGNSRQDIQRLKGKTVRAICSWGKHFLLVFDGFVLRIHFMLFGRYRVDDPREDANPRLTLVFANGRLDLYACSVQFLEGDVDALYDFSRDVMADAWDPAAARKRLRDAPADEIDTTLIVHPAVLQDFLDYNDFLELADALVAELELEGVLQVASFHPRYQFAGTAPDDIENFTNRAPHPTLHLLREDSVSRAVAAYPDPDAIIDRNIETLTRLGRSGWDGLFATDEHG